ncbi:hypothetical protein V8B97DRAFT_1921118 [Scleroderma yunnanense]
MEKLVFWIINHPTDHNILFHNHLSSIPVPTHSPDDRPSGKNKKEVTAAIAKHIFKHNPIYGTLYASDPGKFATSTHSFEIEKQVFIPSFDSKLISSHPNTKHAENFLDLVKTRSTQGDGTEDQGNVDVEEGNIVAGEDEAIHNTTVAVDRENNSTMNFKVGDRGAFDNGKNGGADAMGEDEDGVMETRVLEYQGDHAPNSGINAGPSHMSAMASTPFCLKSASTRSNHSHNKELDLQCEKLKTQHANADIAFCWEQDLKKLDIELKKAEESMLS